MQKVLVITYYWPPAGGPGVQRWLKFTKYMPDFGIKPIVFVPKNADYPILDKSLSDEVPRNLKVIEHPILEPYRFASIFSKKKTKRISSGIIQKEQKQTLLEKLLLWIRGNLFIPDARKHWVKPSVQYLNDFIAENSIETIITTGPPHSVHLIGMSLKDKLGIEWIADFRDPWTTIGYHNKLKLTNSSQQKHQLLESQVLNKANKIIVTSKTTQKEFEHKTRQPIEVITNGFDDRKRSEVLDDNFTISHIGSLLTNRNPTALWHVLGELTKENKTFADKLNIQLVGIVGDDVLESINTFGLSDFVQCPGYVDHEKVLEYQSKSQLLLLLEIDAEETKGIIPGKLFEYMKAKRPILAIGPKDWEAGTIVEATQSGRYFQADDQSSIKEVVLNWFEAYQKGSLKAKAIGIEKYHRKQLTKDLADFITWESS